MSVAEEKALTLPSDIHARIPQKLDAKIITRVGHEAGAMSAWLCTEFTHLGLPMIFLEAFQAAELLKTQRNKTDMNDARGLAQIVRMGGEFVRVVTTRSQARKILLELDLNSTLSRSRVAVKFLLSQLM